jgi:TolB protein
VTTDVANYDALSLTADFRTILASRFETHSNLWLARQGNIDQMRQVTFGGNQLYRRVTWTPDGKIVFPSNASGFRDIWISEADGTGQKRLTDDGSANQLPVVTPDGRYIVYTTDRSVKFNLWRMNIDGSNKVQLTHGEQETAPQASSAWVFFNAPMTGLPGLWRVPIDGGKPERFITERCGGPGISADGKQLACWSKPSGSTPRIAIFPIEGGQPLKIIDARPNPAMQLRWTSDGKALVFCVTPPNRISNMWLQPVAGGQARQLTDFKSEEILGFDWGRDDSLIMARGFTARQVAMIQDSGR